MKVQMIVGKTYSAVMAAAHQSLQISGGLIVSVEALDHFTCESLDTGNRVDSVGDEGITYVARINR